jgi:hypothetical protein
MTDDPLDEKLAAELSRRAASANLSRDWSRRVLLPAVASGIDGRTQPVMTSRRPAFAGLAAVVAILVVMVIALPRLVPGPSPTAVALGNSPQAQPSSVAAPSIHVWSTKEFATAVRATDLGSWTALVAGEIGQNLRRDRFCGPPYQQCFIGPLVGTDPEVGVYADWVRASEGEGVEADGGQRQWKWWTLPTAAQGENLLLHVGDGVVTLLGSVDVARSSVALTLAAARKLDPGSQASNEALIVEGWLNDAEPPGTELILDCGPPPLGSRIDGLPSRFCQPADFLTSEQRPGVGSEARDVSIQVQIGAADRFGRGEISSHGLFAVSPRLYGGCAATPCWLWDVIGRLTDEPLREPSAPPLVGTLTCGPGPIDPDSSVIARARPMIIDETGLVDSCEVVNFEAELFSGVLVTNPDGDESILQVHWAGNPCELASSFKFSRSGGGYTLEGRTPNVGCIEPLVRHAMRMHLRQPVAADSVTADLRPSGVPFTTPVPTEPVATPHSALEPMRCSNDFGLMDRADLIESCAAQEVTWKPDEAGLVASGPTITIIWEGSSCATATSAEMAIVGDGYALSLVDAETPGCEGAPTLHTLTLQVRRPVSTEQLTATANGRTLIWREPRVVPAWWELAPTERPTANSTRLDLLVYERGCASGHSPEGRLNEPTIEYGESAITITYTVQAAPGAQLCPGAPGAPVTIELTEPLGDRRLADGGFDDGDRVIAHDDGLLWLMPVNAEETATRRFDALLGANSCPRQGRKLARVTDAQLTQLADELGSAEGMLGDRLAWVGSAEAAVRELGGFELYQDLDSRWYMIGFAENQQWLAEGVHPGDLVLADITSLTISADRTIWIPGRYWQTFGSADCQWDSDTAPPAGARADEQAFDFTLSISAPSPSWTVGQSLDGFGAALDYSGAQDPVDLGGSGSGLAFAYWTRLDGDPGTSATEMTLDCQRYQLASGERQAIPMPYLGFSHNGQLTLPPGIYRLSAFTDFTIGAACNGQDVDLAASIIVRVR